MKFAPRLAGSRAGSTLHLGITLLFSRNFLAYNVIAQDETMFINVRRVALEFSYGVESTANNANPSVSSCPHTNLEWMLGPVNLIITISE